MDDQMFLHAKDMCKNRLKKLMIAIIDTDVVIIALYPFWDLNVDELWIEFGKRGRLEMATNTRIQKFTWRGNL